MKRDFLIIGSSTIIALIFSSGCKKDSVSQGPPAIVVAQKPTITGISPNTGAAGTVITITGTNIKTTAADDTVRFNGLAAAVTSATTTQLTVNAPVGGSTGNITLTTADGTSNGVNFTYSSSATGPDIYVAGFDGVYAAYWKNGKEVLLTDGTKGSRATAMCISNGDIYVAGYEGLVAKYWKNGTAVSLTNGSLPAAATGIAVSGADVHVSGYVTSTLGLDYTTAAYWKNGGLSRLADTNHISLANGLTLTGPMPTITGVERLRGGHDVNTAFVTSLTGITDYFTDDTTFSYTTSICSSPSGGVYVGGYILSAGEPAPQVWVDGLPLFTSFFNYPGYCYGLAVDSSGAVYLAGTSIQPGKKAIATLYKGPGPTAYDLSDGTNPAGAYGVAVHGSDVYVAGFEYSSAANNYGVAKYWKNGTSVALPVNSSTSGAYAIIVQ